MRTHYEFKPLNVGRWLIWSLFLLVLLIAPKVFSSNLSVTMLSQMGVAIIACLSFNMLLGQGGMLSFGHAVYTGLGAYLAMHALNSAASGALNIPVTLIPLVGGLGGMFFAFLFGYVTTRKAGTTFSMITLGMAELVFAMSLMFSEFFGGEAGVSGNRVVGHAFWGITYGPPIQVYYLTAAYSFVCVGLMYAFTRTPLGRILNAVRETQSGWSSSATTPSMCATWPSSLRVFLRALQAAWRPLILKSSPRKWSALDARALTCCSRIWAARPSFLAPSSVRC